MITTTSYADWRAGFGQPIRVTLGQPRRPEPTGRAHWIYVAELSPAPWYFNAAPEKFERAYVSQLDRYADAIEAKIGCLTGQFGDIALCCFERTTEVLSGASFCHRRLWAQWWQQRTGQTITEGGRPA